MKKISVPELFELEQDEIIAIQGKQYRYMGSGKVCEAKQEANALQNLQELIRILEKEKPALPLKAQWDPMWIPKGGVILDGVDTVRYGEGCRTITGIPYTS